MKLIRNLCLFALSCAILFYAFRGGKPRESPGNGRADKIMPVGVEIVRRGNIFEELELSGDVLPMSQVQLYSKISGRIMDLTLSIGDRVKIGEKIAKIEDDALLAQKAQAKSAILAAGTQLTQAELQVEQANITVKTSEAQIEAVRSSLKNIETELARIGNLMKKNLVSQQSYDTMETNYKTTSAQLKAAELGIEQTKVGVKVAEAAVNVRKAQLKQAEAALDIITEQLSETVIEATIDGVVTEKFMYQGDMAIPGKPILSLAMIDSVKIIANVNERDIGKISPGISRAVITVESLKGATMEAVVQRIYPVLNSLSRTAQAEVRLENPGYRLLPGMFAGIKFIVAEKRGVPIIKRETVLSRLKAPFVYVVENDVAVKKPVKLGIFQEGVIEIIEGLSGGEQLVSRGGFYLRDGSRVLIAERSETR